jgi:hypothetical protein
MLESATTFKGTAANLEPMSKSESQQLNQIQRKNVIWDVSSQNATNFLVTAALTPNSKITRQSIKLKKTY